MTRWRRQEGRGAGNPVQRDASRRVARALSGVDLGSGDAPDLAWLVEPGIGPHRIAGVVRTDGQPIAGAVVELRSELLHLAGQPPLRVSTDDHGAFDFGPQLPTSHAVTARYQDLAPGGIVVQLRNPQQALRADKLVIDLDPCQSWIQGRVHDRDGNPIATAAVVASCMTDEGGPLSLFESPVEADGRFRCAAKPRLITRVNAPGFGDVWLRPAAMPADGDELLLHPEARVEGRVIDRDGVPVSGARIMVYSINNGFLSALAGPEGAFSIGGLPPGIFDVSADHGAHVSVGPQGVAVTPGSIQRDIIIVMQRARLVAGLLLVDDQPLPGARMRPGPTYSQADGSFVISPAPTEPFALSVDHRDIVQARIEAGTEPLDDLVVRARPGAALSGSVTADGVPVAGARVLIDEPSRLHWLLSPPGDPPGTSTDAAGRYRIDGLTAVPREFVASDPATGRRSLPTRVALSEQSEAVADFDLTIATEVSGTVTDPAGNPVARAGIALFRDLSRPDACLFTQTAADGRFRIRGVLPGDYQLRVGRHDRETDWCLPPDASAWPPVQVSDARTRVELNLAVRGRVGLDIAGRAVRDDDTPAAFASVRAFPGGLLEWVAARTDADGNFLLHGLPESEHSVEVVTPDGAIGKATIAGGATGVRLVATRPGAIEGEIVGTDIPCRVHAQHGHFGSPGWNAVSFENRFRIPALPPGPYTVCADGGSLEGAGTTEVRPGETAELKIVLGQTASLDVTVRRFPSGEPVAGVQVRTRNAIARTDAAGKTRLLDISPGETFVTCLDGDQSDMGFADIALEAGQHSTVEIYVLDRGGRVPRPGENPLGAELNEQTIDGTTTLVFEAVTAGSIADRAGASAGDRILRIESADARGEVVSAAVLFLISRAVGTDVRLTVNRNGKEFELVLVY